MKVSFSSSFKRVFKKRIKGNSVIEAKFWKKLEKFTDNPFERSLKTHKLSGKLEDLWSFSVDYDVRVLFYFVDKENAIFIDIGSYDEVYEIASRVAQPSSIALTSVLGCLNSFELAYYLFSLHI